MAAIRVANAPCSYGAFEITVGRLPNVPDARKVLVSMASKIPFKSTGMPSGPFGIGLMRMSHRT